MSDPLPLAIDPRGCGCTECIIGEYVPEENATPQMMALMRLGVIGDNRPGREVVSDLSDVDLLWMQRMLPFAILIGSTR